MAASKTIKLPNVLEGVKSPYLPEIIPIELLVRWPRQPVGTSLKRRGSHISVMAMNPLSDLFGSTALLPGLVSGDSFLGVAEEAELIRQIDLVALSPFEFQGWQGKRLTASFGYHYDFERGQVGAAEPVPDWLLDVKARAASFSGLRDSDLVQALLIRYDPGAGISWHRDRPVFGHVIGISLGAPATMRFRKRTPAGFQRVSAPLEPRAIYHLSGEARYDWEHSITEMDATRWSITFRTFSGKGTYRGSGATNAAGCVST